VSEIISAIASLLWPLLILLGLILFRNGIGGLIRSGADRPVTLEVAGQKLTLGQINDQQNSLIADLQQRVAELSGIVAALADPGKDRAARGRVESADPEHKVLSRSILWVDDNPSNNAIFISQLSERGVQVDLAKSTAEGLKMLDTHNYAAIISDMGREEDKRWIPDAGVRLLQEIRTGNGNLPFIIYSSGRGIRTYGDEARRHGVTAITNSPTVVSEQLIAIGIM
jgi:CheY-like chemotaxis protein